jgi:ADP-heptose:LPS heptosyltransferase
LTSAPDQVRSILLVRLRLVGDVVFTTPLISALRRQYPRARIVYVVENAAAPIVANNPHLTDVIIAPHRRGLGRIADDWTLARRLRRERFDLALDLHGGPRSAWLTRASGATVRVGYDVPGRSWMYTRVVHRPRSLRPRHSVENQWDLLRAVDPVFSAGPVPERDRVEVTLDPRAARAIDGRIAGWHIPAGAQIVVLHVSAGNPFRRWPESAFAELAAALVRGHDGDAAGTRDRQPADNRWLVITGGPSDRAATSRVLADAKARAGAAGERLVDGESLSLGDLRALCERAALYIGGDSGPLHLASASDVPIVGLFGPTLPERSAPWRPAALPVETVDVGALPCRPCDQRVCAPGDFRCLTTLAASDVLAAAERVLSVRGRN